MATEGGPKLVSDGLVLALDAANIKSYPGSGNSIYDLTLNSNGTVISNSTFSTNNNGVIIYGSSQNSGVITLPPISAGLNLFNETYTFWAKCLRNRSSVGGGSFSNWIIQYGSYYSNNSGGFGLQSGNISRYLKGSTSSGWSSSGSIGLGNSIYDTYNWIFYTLQIINGNNIKFYMNNVLIFNTTISDTYTGHSSNVVVLGRNMDTTFSNISVYNKALTAEEILQNYNATKSRFNL